MEAKKYIYPAKFYLYDTGEYSVSFIDFEEIITHGDNLENAIEMAENALCMWIIECEKDGKSLPKSSNIKDIRIADNNAFVNLIIADIELYKNKYSKSVKKTLTIPKWLNDIAEKENVNYSQILQKALKEHLNIAT